MVRPGMTGGVGGGACGFGCGGVVVWRWVDRDARRRITPRMPNKKMIGKSDPVNSKLDPLF